MDALLVKKYYIRVKNFLFSHKNREFLTFLFFLFLSASFWLLQALNETYEVELKVPLQLTNIPKNVVLTEEPPTELNVSVRDKGTVLLRYMYGEENKPVELNYTDYDQGDLSGRTIIPLPLFQEKVQLRYISSSVVTSVKPDTLEYYFNRGNKKKVPVRLTGVLDTAPHCYLEKLDVLPDSLEVLAPQSILDTLQAVYTLPFDEDNLSESKIFHQEYRKIKGTKYMSDKVEVRLKVDMYTEKTVKVPIQPSGFPSDKKIRVFPSKVDVTFRVGTSRYKEVGPNDIEVILPYSDVVNNPTTKVKLHIESYPSFVSGVKINPDIVEFLIEDVSEKN